MFACSRGLRAGYLIEIDGTQLALIEQPAAEPHGAG